MRLPRFARNDNSVDVHLFMAFAIKQYFLFTPQSTLRNPNSKKGGKYAKTAKRSGTRAKEKKEGREKETARKGPSSLSCRVSENRDESRGPERSREEKTREGTSEGDPFGSPQTGSAQGRGRTFNPRKLTYCGMQIADCGIRKNTLLFSKL